MKKICLCADDYALNAGISSGIRELIAANRITATSVITITKNFTEEARRLLPHCDRVDIGLHITLTDLEHLPSIGSLVKAAYTNKLNYDEIKANIAQQLQNFYDHFGFWPKHLDGHQHVHTLPGIRDIVIELFQKYNNGYIRNCVGTFKTTCIKSLFINILSYRLKAKLKALNIATNNGFAGVYNFNKDYRFIFGKFLNSTKDGTLIMCHPGYVDNGSAVADPICKAREHELKFFLSQEFIDMLSTNKVVLA